MPQMFPLFWFILFVMTLFAMIIFSSSLYFFSSPKIHLTLPASKMSSHIWKW